jgi:hypothetical protein
MKVSEKDLQNFLWEKRENWYTFIKPMTFPNISISTLSSPKEILYNLAIRKLEELYDICTDDCFTLIGCEVSLKDIAAKPGRPISADLVGIGNGVNGVFIIELKIEKQPEREAFTELLAYSAHFRRAFPMMNKNDVTNILIAPHDTNIVKKATIHSLVYDDKPTITFIPNWQNDDLSTLQLELWIPPLEEFIAVENEMFAHENIEVFKIAWSSMGEDWNIKEGYPQEYMIANMNKIASYIAQVMEEKGINGFVYAGQYNDKEPFQCPNFIVIGGINPFLLQQNLGNKLLDVIPELSNTTIGTTELHNDTDFLEFLSVGWGNDFYSIAFESIKLLTSNHKGNELVLDHGSMTYEQYTSNYLEDVLPFNYDVFVTGIIRKLYMEYNKLNYDFIAINGYEEHPYLSHGDIPKYVVEYANELMNFKTFLYKMVNPYEDTDDNDF